MFSARGGVPWPSSDPESWNQVTIGGETLPVFCTVSVDIGDDLDIQKPKGGHGASVIFHGKNPAKLKVTCQVVNPIDFATLQNVLDVLRPLSSKREPLSIEHPKATLHKIDTVVIQDIHDPPEEAGKAYKVEFDLVEYYPPPNQAGSKSVSKQLEPRDQVLSADQLQNTPRPKPSATNTKPRR